MKKKKNGFTLIELLVVLAIIGVLIALAIAGLRAAQGSQRDTARKDLISQINAQMQTFQSNNGCYPGQTGCATAFYGAGGFINSSGSCPSGQVMINSTCFGLDGLTLNTTIQASCNNPAGSFTTSNLVICYEPNNGSAAAGYRLGTWLEQTTNVYLVAQ